MNIYQLKQAIDKKYTRLTTKYSRLLYHHRDINSNRYSRKPLTSAQKKEIQRFWAPYCHIGNDAWKWFEFYNSITETPAELKYYIPEGIYYSTVDPHFSKVKECGIIDDKNLYDLFFSDILQPTTICRKQGSLFLNSDYQIISLSQAKELIRQAGEVIIKPTRDSCGGSGICFVGPDTDDASLQEALSPEAIIVQAIVKQHPTLSAIHPQSLNTIRIMTMIRNGHVTPVSAVLRIGTGSARVDNAHSGGVVRGINANGELKPTARNLYGTKFTPTNAQSDDNQVIMAASIPSFNECVNLVCRLAPRLSEFTHLASWDLSVNEAGQPVLIEVNLTYGGVDVHQLCNGPIFGKQTAEILNEVFSS